MLVFNKVNCITLVSLELDIELIIDIEFGISLKRIPPPRGDIPTNVYSLIVFIIRKH